MSRPNQDTDKRVTERIRKEARFYRPTKTILCEAADRIEELERQLEALQEKYTETKTTLTEMLETSKVDAIVDENESLKRQLAEKEELLLMAFQDAKEGVVQMTRKYDEWIAYLKIANEDIPF